MAEDLHRFLKETYPAVFRKPYKPMAIGIHKMLFERHSDLFTMADIKNYLSGFTRSHFYNGEILRSGLNSPRYDLDGKEDGAITEKGMRHSAMMLCRRWPKIKEPTEADEAAKEIANRFLPAKMKWREPGEEIKGEVKEKRVITIDMSKSSENKKKG